MLCAKIIAPASYAALLQLQPEQLSEVVTKHPSLRSGLREYVIKKGGLKARALDVLGNDDSPAPTLTPMATTV
jgi:symplekin